jgi:bacterioferritin (cytochrome b1)
MKRKKKKKNKSTDYPLIPGSLAEMTTDEDLKRREWRIRRVLTLEELIRLNRRGDEFSEGRYPPAPQLDINLEPKALTGVLRLVMRDALRQNEYQQYGRPEELSKLLDESEENIQLLEAFPSEIAAIISQTYAELGDGAPLTDDEALYLIREKLLEYDEHLIDGQRRRGVALVRSLRRKDGSDANRDNRDNYGIESSTGN